MPNSAFQSAMRAGVTGQISDTFKGRMAEDTAMRTMLYKFIPTTKGDARQILLSFKSSTPFPSLWKYGTSRDYKGLKDYFHAVNLYNYQLNITWDKFDESDDQLQDIRSQASSAVVRFFEMQDVLYTEYLDGVKDLNPSLGLSWTGTSLFNTVDGDGNDLYGVSGGNIITGTGTSASAIQHDLAQVRKRAMNMKDPIAGRPLFRNSEITYDKFHCISPAGLDNAFLEASESKFFKRKADNNTSEDNIFLNKISYTPNQNLIDQNDWFVVINHPTWKPFILRSPGNVETFMSDESNSDIARDKGQYGIHMNVRTGLVPYMQNVIYKISNS